MCGIFALLRKPAERSAPSRPAIEHLLSGAVTAAQSDDVVAGFHSAARLLVELDEELKGAAGVESLIRDAGLMETVRDQVAAIDAVVVTVESDLDAGRVPEQVGLEALNAALVALKDATWAISKDRLRTATAVAELLAGGSGVDPARSAVEAYTSIQLALSAIDRLEVRGRDSAGIAVTVAGHGLDGDELSRAVSERDDPMFLAGAVHREGEAVVFVYKEAAEIGALGDNVKGLRQQVVADSLLRQLISRPGVRVSVVSHTRWASVGTVSQANAHPVDSRELVEVPARYVIASLNGDVDNYAELKVRHGLEVSDEITTDAKVIPVLVARRMGEGADFVDAFRSTVDEFEGSVAIAAVAADDPDRLLLAVRGSGQGCYIGLAENAFLVASEPYGLVEECSRYVRMDGEVASPVSGKNGQIIELRSDGAGTLAGMRRLSYGGEELPVDESELITAEVTTRDIDRGDATHFLLKEITESPQTVRRTLRGKISDEGGRRRVTLPEEALPEAIRKSLAGGAFRQIIAVGQGTAAIAARSLDTVLQRIAPSSIAVEACPATELSGFRLRDDMSDTLVVAVSQSGTTTDTNRTVDMVRSRGAKVIAIVNRRQSDLTEKADGVLYTSDGRDIEMSVASTKAFYAQVTAASLLAIAIAENLGDFDRREAQAIVAAMRSLPEAMEAVLAKRPELAAAAQRFAPSRRSWAVVGNGPNHIAAQELRIKLSELCYKSIAVDVTEDKKHVDLSAEPMIFVCAAGLDGSTASDVVKEVAIYRAHKATPVVISSEGVDFAGAVANVTVPAIHPTIDFLLSTMAGHLFGYEAALAIDGQARLVRAARAALDDAVAVHAADDDELLAHVSTALTAPAQAIFAELLSGALNGHLEPSTAVRLHSLLRYATGIVPLDVLEVETGRPTSPTQMLTDLATALTNAIDELTRPIDAVKHQAKTVTVGISRAEESFADSVLVKETVAAGASRDSLSYRSVRTLAVLDSAAEAVTGYTRYEIEGDVVAGTATIRVVDRGGIAREISSRADSDPRLTGTKHRAAFERLVTVGRGERDGRSVIIVPETKDQQVTGITLLHVRFRDQLPADQAKAVLTAYRNRYSALVDAVTETEPFFDDSLLEQVGIVDLLVEPVRVLAEQWRGRSG